MGLWRPAWMPGLCGLRHVDVTGDLTGDAPPERWLVFADQAGLSDDIVARADCGTQVT